jgi:hypothetical protein
MNQAAGEAARFAATGADDDDVKDQIEEQTHDLVNDNSNCSSGLNRICIRYLDGPNGEDAGDIGSIVAVYIRYEYDLITPLSNFGSDGRWRIESCSKHRVERPPSGSFPTGSDPC